MYLFVCQGMGGRNETWSVKLETWNDGLPSSYATSFALSTSSGYAKLRINKATECQESYGRAGKEELNLEL